MLKLLLLSTCLGTAPAQGPLKPIPPVDPDSTVVLTQDVLSRMEKFWNRLEKEPDSIRKDGRLANQKMLPVINVNDKPIARRVVDMNAMAATYPAVAADLKAVGMTAAQWERARWSLYKAVVLGGLPFGPNVVPPGSVDGRNMAFLTAHPHALDALRNAKMWFPNPSQVLLEIQKLSREGA